MIQTKVGPPPDPPNSLLREPQREQFDRQQRSPRKIPNKVCILFFIKLFDFKLNNFRNIMQITSITQTRPDLMIQTIRYVDNLHSTKPIFYLKQLVAGSKSTKTK